MHRWRIPRVSVFALLLSLAAPPLRAADPAGNTTALSLGGGTAMAMRRVEAGTFERRSTGTGGPAATAAPARTVTLTHPFLIGVRPVTREQFTRFASASGYRTEAEVGRSGGFGLDGSKFVQRPGFSWRDPGFAQAGTDPVVLVTRGDAEAFLRWLSKTVGRECTLPTEAQWELAAHAGLPGEHPDGQPTHRQDPAAPPGPRRDPWRNALGLDLLDSGVHEWVKDWDGPEPATFTDPVQDNPAAASPSRGILRGRSWFRDLAGPLSFHQRHRATPGSRQADIGFRVVMADAAISSLPATPSPISPTPPPAQAAVVATTPVEAPTPAPPTTAAPSPAPIPPTPAAAPPASGLSWGRLLALLLGGLTAFAAAVALLFPRRQLTTAAPRGNGGGRGETNPLPPAIPRASRQQVEIVEDGFWVQSDAPEGTAWRCLFNVDAVQHERTIRFQPGPRGMFIGTGRRPSSIVIVPAVNPFATPSGRAEGDFASGSYLAAGGTPPMPPPLPMNRRRSREPGAY